MAAQGDDTGPETPPDVLAVLGVEPASYLRSVLPIAILSALVLRVIYWAMCPVLPAMGATPGALPMSAVAAVAVAAAFAAVSLPIINDLGRHSAGFRLRLSEKGAWGPVRGCWKWHA